MRRQEFPRVAEYIPRLLANKLSEPAKMAGAAESSRRGTRLDTQFIQGTCKRGEEFVIILDLDKVLTSGEVQPLVEEVTHPFPGSVLATSPHRGRTRCPMNQTW